MTLERGWVYNFNPDHPVICLNCGEDLSEQAKKSLLIYLGKLDGEDLFIYNTPPECPVCHHVLRWHVHQWRIDVTDEFRKLLDRRGLHGII